MASKPAPTRGHFPSRWSAAKKVQYQHMVAQIADDVTFRTRQRGSQKKPIVNKEFDLVKKYYELLYGSEHQAGLKQGVRQQYAFKDRKRTEKLMADIGQPSRGLRYAYLNTYLDPNTGKPAKVKVKHRAKKPDLTYSNNVIREHYTFDRENMVTDTEGELKNAFNYLQDSEDDLDDDDTTDDRFSIQVGDDREINEPALTRDAALRRINQLMYRYGDWDKWLNGIIKLTPTNQKTVREMQKDINRHLSARKLWLKAQRNERNKQKTKSPMRKKRRNNHH